MRVHRNNEKKAVKKFSSLSKFFTHFFSSCVIKNLFEVFLDHYTNVDQKVSTKKAKKLVKKVDRILILILVYNLNSIFNF